MFTKKFLLALLERAVKTWAQAAAGVLLASEVVGVMQTNWLGVLSAATMAAITSILLNIGVGAVTDGGPSFGNVEELAPEWNQPPEPPDPGVDPVDTEPPRG